MCQKKKLTYTPESVQVSIAWPHTLWLTNVVRKLFTTLAVDAYIQAQLSAYTTYYIEIPGQVRATYKYCIPKKTVQVTKPTLCYPTYHELGVACSRWLAECGLSYPRGGEYPTTSGWERRW